jgi:hypothetical protein
MVRGRRFSGNDGSPRTARTLPREPLPILAVPTVAPAQVGAAGMHAYPPRLLHGTQHLMPGSSRDTEGGVLGLLGPASLMRRGLTHRSEAQCGQRSED